MSRLLILVGLPAVILFLGRFFSSQPCIDTPRRRTWHWIPLVFFIITAPLALLRLWAGWSTWLDIGLYAFFVRQLGWGDFTSLVFPHLSPLLLIFWPLNLLPAAWLAPALVLIQAAAIAGTLSVFVRLASRRAPASLPSIVCMSVLMYPLWYLALVNFRLEAVWLLVVSLAVREFVEERERRFFFWCTASLLVKTHLIVPTVVFAVYATWKRRWWLSGIVLATVGGFLLGAENLWWRPAAQHFVEGRVLGIPLIRLAQQGEWGVLTNSYWILAGTILLSTGLVAIRAPAFLVPGLPVFLYLMWPVPEAYLQLENHYAVSILPFLLGAVVLRAQADEGRGRALKVRGLLPALLVVHFLCAPSPFSQRFWRPGALPYSASCYRPTVSLSARETLVLQTIPPEDAISLENDVVLGGLLMPRRIEIFPEGTARDEPNPWVVLSNSGGDWVLDRHDPVDYRKHVNALDTIGYRLVASRDGLLIYRYRRR